MNGREIVLGVTGGIAAYKPAELASRLVQAGASVTAVLTEAAERFIGATTFEALTARPVHRQLFSPMEHYQGEHIGLAKRAEALVVAPASADFIAKLAHGLADDLLSTLALAVACPIVVAPAMNVSIAQRDEARIDEQAGKVRLPGGLSVDDLQIDRLTGRGCPGERFQQCVAAVGTLRFLRGQKSRQPRGAFIQMGQQAALVQDHTRPGAALRA